MAAIDSPNFFLEDPELVRKDGLRARALGFTGMFAVHPRQLSTINEVFTPSPQEVEDANLILQEAAARGETVFRWKGQMVDGAMLRRARHVLERHQGRVRAGS